MAFAMFCFTTWFYPMPWASFGFMVLTILGCISGLIVDNILPWWEHRNDGLH